MVQSALHGLPTTLSVSGGHERALMSLLFVLLFGGTIGGTFTDVLIPPRLAIETIEDCSDRFFARGMASGNVLEFLGGSWALTS